MGDKHDHFLLLLVGGLHVDVLHEPEHERGGNRVLPSLCCVLDGQYKF